MQFLRAVRSQALTASRHMVQWQGSVSSTASSVRLSSCFPWRAGATRMQLTSRTQMQSLRAMASKSTGVGKGGEGENETEEEKRKRREAGEEAKKPEEELEYPFNNMPEELKTMSGTFKPDLRGYREYLKQKREEGSELHLALDEPQEWYKRLLYSAEFGYLLLMSIIASLSWNLVRRKRDQEEWEHEKVMREAALMERIEVLEQSLKQLKQHQAGKVAGVAAGGEEAAVVAKTASKKKSSSRIVL